MRPLSAFNDSLRLPDGVWNRIHWHMYKTGVIDYIFHPELFQDIFEEFLNVTAMNLHGPDYDAIYGLNMTYFSQVLSLDLEQAGARQERASRLWDFDRSPDTVRQWFVKVLNELWNAHPMVPENAAWKRRLFVCLDTFLAVSGLGFG